jgi:carbamate kinase
VLAHQIGGDMLVISTVVEEVCLSFGKLNRHALDGHTGTRVLP